MNQSPVTKLLHSAKAFKKKAKLDVADTMPSLQRAFETQMTFEPVVGKTSVELRWPDGRLFALVTHDEISRFLGLERFLAHSRVSRLAKIVLQLSDTGVGAGTVGAPKEPHEVIAPVLVGSLEDVPAATLEGLVDASQG
jgi:hypothetical protein